MSSINPVNPNLFNPSNLGSEPTALEQLVDAAWEAQSLYGQNPDDMNMKDLMQTINALNKYFGGTAPTDPTALAMYNAINNTVGNTGKTLAELSSEYGTANSAAAVTTLEQDGSSAFSNLSSAIDGFTTNPHGDSTNKTISTDINNLQSDLETYNYAMQEGNVNPSTIQQLLKDVAADIANFSKDAKSAGISDGFLTQVETFLGTSGSATAPDSLLALATAQPFDSTAFANALKNIGEGTSSGGDLSRLLAFTQKWEYHPPQ